MKLVIILLSLALGISQVEAANIIYQKSDSAKVVNLLRKAASLPRGVNRMVWFGKQFLGVPYVANTLEVGNSEKLVVNLRQLDCTTYIETVSALTLADKRGERSFTGFCKALKQLRYRNGQIAGYPSRLHYFSFWAADNQRKGIVADCVTSRTPYAKGQRILLRYMSRHAESYKHLRNNPGYVREIARQERAFDGKVRYYIPKSYVGLDKSKLAFIHDGDILATTTTKPGLDASHLGIAVWQNGRLHLMNASYIYKKVVLDKNTLYNYQRKQRSQTGINVLRLR